MIDGSVSTAKLLADNKMSMCPGVPYVGSANSRLEIKYGLTTTASFGKLYVMMGSTTALTVMVKEES